jgi:hypothetical protein
VRLRGRRSTPIAEFWKWWADTGADAFAGAAATGDYGRLPEQLSKRVHAIDPGLAWELGRGTHAQHVLVVTSAGVPELRSTAERWVLGAPPESAVWEYSSCRRPDPAILDHQLDFDGRSLGVDEMRVSLLVDEPRLKVDVRAHHPVFAELPPESQGQITFLVLDWLLGEDDVTRWVGEVTWSPSTLDDGLPLDALTETIAALDARNAHPVWVLIDGRTPSGARLIASAQRPLRWIDNVLMDQHIAVRIDYTAYVDETFGLPTPDGLDWLRDIEDGLMTLIGEWVMLVAHETGAGHRTLHLYTAPETEAATQAEAWAAPISLVAVEVSADPGWAKVRHLI